MKFGIRKPSIKKSVASKTGGKSKRKAKKSIMPTYGKKGAGAIKSPARSTKNRIYNKGTKKFFK
ncbi:hypothetical protein C7H83_10560 [Tetragenococcus halophilus]|uniref:Phage protein n=1 Tax=Tetragenococcus halophilus TaxID=51669 RepID=A0A3G5FKJ6_TETHA|nr:hypothetical protein [Tetragenococcus halophilus]AYW50877.1 hypothetical protein C7H83_10560 [Tetragenococcus halophilus]